MGETRGDKRDKGDKGDTGDTGRGTNAQYFDFWCVRYALSVGAASPTGEAMPQALRSVQVPNAQCPMPNLILSARFTMFDGGDTVMF
ncbi:hypothetical protein NIES2100_75580 [Calothrix sp. NIES-2100]|nr:hypothetical protein NIES2100_75580 [Calothrix sp. NIES-2100]